MPDPIVALINKAFDAKHHYPAGIADRIHRDNERENLGYHVHRRLSPWITRRRNAGQAPTTREIYAKYDELRKRLIADERKGEAQA